MRRQEHLLAIIVITAVCVWSAGIVVKWNFSVDVDGVLQGHMDSFKKGELVA